MMKTIPKVLILAAMPAVLAAPAPAAAQQQRDDGSKMVCKREAKTGTRFATQICKTKAQWEQLAEQQKRDYAEQRDRPQIEIRRGN